jgi:hypothetical protein
MRISIVPVEDSNRKRNAILTLSHDINPIESCAYCGVMGHNKGNIFVCLIYMFYCYSVHFWRRLRGSNNPIIQILPIPKHSPALPIAAIYPAPSSLHQNRDRYSKERQLTVQKNMRQSFRELCNAKFTDAVPRDENRYYTSPNQSKLI